MSEGLLHVTTDRPNPKLDVLFVHGLMGNRRDTWTNAQGQFWPDWLAADFPEIGIWSFGYNASLSAWTEESMPLADRGNSLLDQLSNDGFGKARPLVFITHSMGGLAVKQLLRNAESLGVERWESISKNTAGVAFLSTPHSGAHLANFATFVSAVLRTNPQLADMERHSSRLRELHTWFLAWHRRRRPAPVCRTWVERMEVRPAVLGIKVPKGFVVVDATSGEPGIPGEVAVPLDEDHISIAKPDSPDAPVYKGIKAFIRECLGTAGTPETGGTGTALPGGSGHGARPPGQSRTTYAVSYSWRDQSRETVERLCAEAEARGIRIMKFEDLRPGEKLSEFTVSLAGQDRVFVILSDAYLRSENCMLELSEIWRLCQHDDSRFHGKVRVFRLPDAPIHDLGYQLGIIEHWERQHRSFQDRVSALTGPGSLSPSMLRQFNNLRVFAQQAGEIMSGMADRLLARDFEEFVAHGFPDAPSNP